MGELKNMYGSGIKALDNLAEELKGNNQLTYQDLKSQVAKHCSRENKQACIKFDPNCGEMIYLYLIIHLHFI